MSALGNVSFKLRPRVLLALIQCGTMATEVVEVATESEEDVQFRYSGKNLMRFIAFTVRFCRYAPLLGEAKLNIQGCI